MTLHIELDIPEPPDTGRYKDLIEAYSKMEVGNSVVFYGSHSYIHALAGDVGIRIRVRALDGLVAMRGQKEYRIWRVG